MKRTVLFIVAFLGLTISLTAQGTPKPVTTKVRPVAEKANSAIAPGAKPTAKGQQSQEKAQEEIKKSRAEKRAKMEQAKKEVREKIAADTSGTKK
jgi:hypothetical protein